MARPRMRTLMRTKEGRKHLVWLDENYCKHGHPYLTHFNCYLNEHPEGVIKERIGFLDIEACLALGQRILTADLRWVKVEEIIIGDEIIGFDDDDKLGVKGQRRRLRRGKVLAAFPSRAKVYKIKLSDGTELTATGEHKWLGNNRGTKNKYNRTWHRTDTMGQPRSSTYQLHRVMPVWETDSSYNAGWLAGFLDGEGSLNQSGKERKRSFALTVAQNKNVASDRWIKYIKQRGLDIKEYYHIGGFPSDKQCVTYRITGDYTEAMKLIGEIRPTRILDKFDADKLPSMRTNEWLGVVSVEEIGIQTIINLQTDIGTYLAEGFACHNTNLKADFGIVICYCIKPNNADKIIERCVKPRELKKCLDKNVVKQAIADMLLFDRIVWHYGSRFDGGFLRARALKLDLHFPEYKSIWQTDTWAIAKRKLNISSNRLGNLAAQCNITEEKTPITPEHWLGALQGKRESLDYILDHCRRDVLILEKVYGFLKDFSPKSKTSI